MRDEANELQAIEEDDFAQDIANAVYISVDSLVAKLIELTEKHNEPSLRKDIMLYVKQKS
jgi:hypothetical protein